MVKSQNLAPSRRVFPEMKKPVPRTPVRNNSTNRGKISVFRAIASIILLAFMIAGVILIVRQFAKPSDVDPTREAAVVPADTTEADELTSPIIAPLSTEAEIMDEWIPDRKDVELIARTIWGEGRGIQSMDEKAAIVWCILNRVDAEGYACGNSIEYVITFPHQFDGYDPSYPVTDEHVALAEDVLMRWHAEREGVEDVGRVLPKEYIYFIGDGTHNYFTIEWKGTDYWDWSLPSPYSGEGASYGMD